MRVLQKTMALAAFVGFAPAWTTAQAQVSPADLLSRFKPTVGGVEYDTPTEKSAVDACKVEWVKNAEGKKIGYVLRDGQGRLLRKFVDTNGKKDAKGDTKLDQWSYYQDGFEVYREIDKDDDGSLDELRWLNSGGSRIAAINKGRISGWLRLSAEEASKVLVQAIVGGDAELLETVIASPEELAALGMPEGVVERATKSRKDRLAKPELAVKRPVGWTAKTAWSRFDGMMPHVIPADAAGSKDDILLYENAVVFAAAPEGADPSKMAYLTVPEVVKLGAVWKFVELPRSIDPANPAAEPLVAGIIREGIYGGAKASVEGGDDEIARPLLDALANHDKSYPGPDAARKELAQWHLDRVDVLRQVLAAAKKPETKLIYNKQAVNDVSEAYKTGLYPDGAGVLDKFVNQGGKIGSFALYRKVLAEFDIEAEQPGANLLDVQKATLAKLDEFLKRFADSEEVPDVLLQLGTVHEFNNEEKEARPYYERLAKDHAATSPGKLAIGALKRLDLEGKPFALSGPGLDGKLVNVAAAKGKPVLVLFWTTASDPEKRELADLAQLRKKHQDTGLEIIGICLDPERSTLDAFLKENSVPWTTIYEPGGMESRLASEYGILSTPTMFLIDAQGKVVSRKLRKASDVEKALEKPVASRPVGANIGRRN